MPKRWVTVWRVRSVRNQPAIVTRGGLSVLGGEVLIPGREPQRRQMLYRLDLADGAVHAEHDLRWAASALVPIGDGLLVANNTGGEAAPGLYRIGPDGGDPEPVLDEAVWQLRRQGDLVLTLSRQAFSAARTLRVHEAGSLGLLWSAAARGDVAELHGDLILAVAEGGDHGVLVAREASGGAERWRTGPSVATSAASPRPDRSSCAAT